MGKSITIHCTLCGRQTSRFIPNHYGESGNRYEDQYVAGCEKCHKERQREQQKRYKESMSYSSGGGSYSSSGSSETGCLSTLGGLIVVVLAISCCCGGFGNKS